MTLAREMALESEYVMGTFARKPVEFVEGHGMTLHRRYRQGVPRLPLRHRRVQPRPLPPLHRAGRERCRRPSSST